MPLGLRAYYARLTERMITFGPNLGMPFTQSLGQGLFELRIKAKEGISRVFYCTIKQGNIVMLHGLIKKTQKTPKKDLKIATKRMKEVMNHET
jgi:phage-related protein